MKKVMINLEEIIQQSRSNKSLQCCANIEQIAISVNKDLKDLQPKVEMAQEMFDLIERLHEWTIDKNELSFPLVNELEAVYLKATAIK